MDYLAPSCVTEICDDPGASIEALSHGDLKGFFANQPAMGSFSLLVRTPPAIVTAGNDLAVYRSGVFICVLAAGLLGVFLAMSMLRRGRPWTVWALLGTACVVNPLTYQAAYWGHPEEVLGAVLAVGAVIAAGRRHWLIGGLMLAAALAQMLPAVSTVRAAIEFAGTPGLTTRILAWVPTRLIGTKSFSAS